MWSSPSRNSSCALDSFLFSYWQFGGRPVGNCRAGGEGASGSLPCWGREIGEEELQEDLWRWAPGGDPSEFQFIHLPGSRLGPGTGVPAATRYTMKTTQVPTSPIAFPGPWVKHGRERAPGCDLLEATDLYRGSSSGPGLEPQWPHVLVVRVCPHLTEPLSFQDPI